jgi:hypothetical protein
MSRQPGSPERSTLSISRGRGLPSERVAGSDEDFISAWEKGLIPGFVAFLHVQQLQRVTQTATAALCSENAGTDVGGNRRLNRVLMGWTPPDGIDVPKWRC